MSKPYSKDLRSRVVAAIEDGLSRRQAAAHFDVGISTAIRWFQRLQETGSVSPLPMGGDHRSHLTGQRDWLLERIAAKPDLTLAAIREELAERGCRVGHATVWRFFHKEKISFKKKHRSLRARQA
jgi:putative transposase